MRGIENGLAADLDHDLHRNAVVGLRQRIGQRGAAGIFVGVVLGRPAADRNRPVDDFEVAA